MKVASLLLGHPNEVFNEPLIFVHVPRERPDVVLTSVYGVSNVVFPSVQRQNILSPVCNVITYYATVYDCAILGDWPRICVASDYTVDK